MSELIETTIAESLEWNNEVFLACVMKNGEVIKSEIQESDYWVGGDPGGWTNDSNIYFDSPQSAERYYKREYSQFFAFEDSYDADEKCEELERI